MLVADSVGENIRIFRQQRGLTQLELAVAVHVARTTVVAWEAGRSSPQAADLAAIAEALGVRRRDLVEDRLEPIGSRGHVELNVGGIVDELRGPGVHRLPIYRWGSLGDPRDHLSAPDPDRMDYPPLGRESLVGPHGFGVEVRGESMVGRGIHDGDVCWVNPERPYRPGGVVLALVDADGESGMVVKTYAHMDVGDCLVSETATGKSTVVCDQYRIIGPVVLVAPRPFPPR